MTLDDILTALFGAKHGLKAQNGLVAGRATLTGHGDVHVLGVTDGIPLGFDEAIVLADQVLMVAAETGDIPIVMLIDSSSQRMSRRDEMLGLNEYLAHLGKSLMLADASGHRSIGLLYGGSAAGAFIATALSCSTLVALPESYPAVMDFPSMARVTKLPVATLQRMSKSTPVFAPGIENIFQVGAVASMLDPKKSLADQLAAALTDAPTTDDRAELGKKRGGRPKAFDVAATVKAAMLAGG